MASPFVSPSFTRTNSATDSTGNLTPTATWTSDQEARLTYCQDQLKQAQKKWSDRQELWIREVEHLLELKRQHKKAQKKQQKAHADKAFRKVKTWRPLSRTQSNVLESSSSTTTTAATTTASFTGLSNGDDDDEDEDDEGGEEGEDDDDDDDDDEDDGYPFRGVARSESMPQQPTTSTFPTTSPTPTSPTPHPATASTTTTPTSPPPHPTTPTSGRNNPFKKIIRRMSSSTTGFPRR